MGDDRRHGTARHPDILDGIQEGGVRTQKVTLFGILGILAVACAFGVIAVADDASAAEVFSLGPKENDYGKVSGSLTYTLDYAITENGTIAGVLEDSDGKSVGTVSVGGSTLYKSGSTRSITVTLPADAGNYTLKVTVTVGETDYVRYASVKAVDPIKLSVTIENKGAAARSFVAYFWIQGDDGTWSKIEDSKQDVSVTAKGEKTVTYDYVVKDVESTTFCLKQSEDDTSIGGEISGLGEQNAHTFYTSGNDYRLVEYLCIGVLVVLLIIAIWIYRKPIKNRGKPKARR